MKKGIKTAALGQWLTRSMVSSGSGDEYQVFYDHGDSREPNVVAIKGFYGEEVTNLNRLADVDIIVVGPNHLVEVIVEPSPNQWTGRKAHGRREETWKTRKEGNIPGSSRKMRFGY